MTRSHLVRQQNVSQSFNAGLNTGVQIARETEARRIQAIQAREERAFAQAQYEQARKNLLADRAEQHAREAQITANQNKVQFRQSQWNKGVTEYGNWLQDVETQAKEVLKPQAKQMWSEESQKKARQVLNDVAKRRQRLSADPGNIDFQSAYQDPYRVLGLDMTPIDFEPQYDENYIKRQQLELEAAQAKIRKDDALAERALRAPVGGGSAADYRFQRQLYKEADNRRRMAASGIGQMYGTIKSKWADDRDEAWNNPEVLKPFTQYVVPAMQDLMDPEITGDPGLSDFVATTASKYNGALTPKDFHNWSNDVSKKYAKNKAVQPLAAKAHQYLFGQ